MRKCKYIFVYSYNYAEQNVFCMSLYLYAVATNASFRVAVAQSWPARVKLLVDEIGIVTRAAKVNGSMEVKTWQQLLSFGKHAQRLCRNTQGPRESS